MVLPFFTIGHSTRSTEAFVGLLQEAKVILVVDVRTIPRSRSNPQFNRDTLPASLGRYRIAYEHLPSLGGLREAQRGVPADVNAFWENASFRNYADYALGSEFHQGLRQLREWGHRDCLAVMCAESLWWRCHRRIITDYLLAAGEEVFHILGHNHVERARLTEAARIQSDGAVRYPPTQPGLPGVQ